MHKPVFYIISGLPGSGKTSLANKLRHESGRRHVYVNRDTMRGLLGYEAPDDLLADELTVTLMCDDLIQRAVASNRDVWFDNINGSIGRLKKQYDGLFTVQVITVFADPDLCIQRQEFRERKVPAEVIYSFYNRFEHFRDIEAAKRLGTVYLESEPK